MVCEMRCLSQGASKSIYLWSEWVVISNLNTLQHISMKKTHRFSSTATKHQETDVQSQCVLVFFLAHEEVEDSNHPCVFQQFCTGISQISTLRFLELLTCGFWKHLIVLDTFLHKTSKGTLFELGYGQGDRIPTWSLHWPSRSQVIEIN